MKHLHTYGSSIFVLIVFFLWVYFDSKYDYEKVPEDFVVMEPFIKREHYQLIKSPPSIKKLSRGKSVVKFRYQMIWGENETSQYKEFFSRVVAVEGDSFEIKNGEIYINEKLLDVPEVKNVALKDNIPPILIPRGHIYVMNDQRASVEAYYLDSRLLGPIPYNLVIGVAQ